ncbi:alpha/beta-hydrolase [Trametes sanguinea]|nr:alpha/beta-hydrolase [Trametes sanguinea]
MEIAYGPLPAHRLDYYSSNTSQQSDAPLLVFVHGGAWRSEDKADHAALARTLVDRTGCAVAVPNYRLTTPDNPIQHPSHSQDVLRSLHFLSTWSGPEPSKPLPPPSRIYLLGHSCSAHILASIFLSSPYDELTPSPELLAATRGIACSEGIYDIDRLLHTFPTYREWFIAPAFGNSDDFSHVNVASYPLRKGGEHIRWLIIHSDADTLVNRLQSQTMYDHLCTLAAASGLPGRVEKNFDELKEEHNDLLQGQVYPRIIADFVKQDLVDAHASAA